MIKGSKLYAESRVRVFRVTTLLTMTTLNWSLTGTLESGLREILSYRANSVKQPDLAKLVFTSEAAENSPEARKFQGRLVNQSDTNSLPV